jgi:hypothetical protein
VSVWKQASPGADFVNRCRASVPWLLAMALALSGCSFTAPGKLANRSLEQARRFTPPPGQSGIYVIRTWGFVGAGQPFTVDLDADSFGKVGTNSFLYAVVPPGLHNLRVLNQSDGFTFSTEPDKNYFFLIASSITGRLTQIPESEGRDYVSRFK